MTLDMSREEDQQDEATVPTARMLSWARNSAIYRLNRRMHTEKQLFDAITRKAREKFDGVTAAQVKALGDFAVGFAYENKALDDKAFSEISSRSGMRSGRSKRMIAQKLSQKGVAADLITDAVGDVDDLYAAVVMARKRAFGPFRRGELDEKRQLKELSAFARAGFGFGIGRRVFDMAIDEAEEILDAGRGF